MRCREFSFVESVLRMRHSALSVWTHAS